MDSWYGEEASGKQSLPAVFQRLYLFRHDTTDIPRHLAITDRNNLSGYC